MKIACIVNRTQCCWVDYCIVQGRRSQGGRGGFGCPTFFVPMAKKNCIIQQHITIARVFLIVVTVTKCKWLKHQESIYSALVYKAVSSKDAFSEQWGVA